MSAPVSFTVRPPTAGQPRAGGWKAPSQRMFHDHDDDEDDFAGLGGRDRSAGRREAKREDERIHGFGNGRALGSRKSPEPLTIAPLPNRDWRAVTRRTPSYRPEARRTEAAVTHERTGDAPQRSGIRQLNGGTQEDDVKPGVSELDRLPPVAASDTEDRKPLSLDEQALAALLAGETEASSTDPALNELVIGNDMSEEAALARDLPDLPEESTLDDYAAIPVEAFGAAILRGMGYDPKNDAPLHVPKPRPALLGIGATSLSSELPPSRNMDAKKRKEARATRGGRGYNAAALLVRRDGSDSGASTPRDSRRSSPGAGSRRRREEDDDGREPKRRDRDDRDKRYETDEERAMRKAKERERDRDRDRRDRERERGSEDRRDRYDDRDRRDRDRDRRDDRRRDDRERDRRDRDRR